MKERREVTEDLRDIEGRRGDPPSMCEAFTGGTFPVERGAASSSVDLDGAADIMKANFLANPDSDEYRL